jgi:hypothetical protein
MVERGRREGRGATEIQSIVESGSHERDESAGPTDSSQVGGRHGPSGAA